MTRIKWAPAVPSIALLLTVATAPVHAAIIVKATDGLFVRTDQNQPLVAEPIDLVSTDGRFTTEGVTNRNGGICILGSDNPAVEQGREGCKYLADGDYRLFVGNEEPVRFSVRNGDIEIPAEPRRTRTGLLAGAAVVVAAGLAGGGGGGGSSSDDEPEPVENISLSVSPRFLEGSFQFGVSPCPTTIGDINVTNTGDIDGRITVSPINGISITGQGQLLSPGQTGTVTVLFNCLSISAIAGNIGISLTADDAVATTNVEVVVDFQ